MLFSRMKDKYVGQLSCDKQLNFIRIIFNTMREVENFTDTQMC